MARIEPHEDDEFLNVDHVEDDVDSDQRRVCWAPVRGVVGTLQFAPRTEDDAPRPLVLRGLSRVGPGGGRAAEHTFWVDGALFTLEQESYLEDLEPVELMPGVEERAPAEVARHHVRLVLEFDTVAGPEGDRWSYQLIEPGRPWPSDGLTTPRAAPPSSLWPLPPPGWMVRGHVRERPWVSGVVGGVAVALGVVAVVVGVTALLLLLGR